MKLKPVTIETEGGPEVTLFCTHREQWPPAHARLGKSFEDLRAGGAIDDNKYQQLKTWESTCGLLEMSAEKCATCPLALVDDGKGHLVPFAPSGAATRRVPPFARAARGRDKR